MVWHLFTLSCLSPPVPLACPVTGRAAGEDRQAGQRMGFGEIKRGGCVGQGLGVLFTYAGPLARLQASRAA